MKVLVKVYNKSKYERDSFVMNRVEYDIFDWAVVSGKDAKSIEAFTDGSGIDEYHEYLVMTLENGETSTFRNSHVDIFVM